MKAFDCNLLEKLRLDGDCSSNVTMMRIPIADVMSAKEERWHFSQRSLNRISLSSILFECRLGGNQIMIHECFERKLKRI